MNVLHLVRDHPFPEDLHQLAPELHIGHALEVLNAVMIAFLRARAQQTGGADHLLRKHEIQKDHLRELLETAPGVLPHQFIQNGYTLHKLPRGTRDLVLRLPETARLNLHTETKTLPDQHRVNVLLCVL